MINHVFSPLAGSSRRHLKGGLSSTLGRRNVAASGHLLHLHQHRLPAPPPPPPPPPAPPPRHPSTSATLPRGAFSSASVAPGGDGGGVNGSSNLRDLQLLQNGLPARLPSPPEPPSTLKLSAMVREFAAKSLE